MDSSSGNSPFIPVYDFIPEKWEEARQSLTQILRLISNGINVREIGSFYNQEQLTGQRFIPTGDQGNFRSVFRKVIPIGAITTKTVPHGIAIASNAAFRFTHIYGTGNDPTGKKYIPLPYSSASSVANNIQIDVDATNVIITTGGAYTAYSDSFVVLEYVQEA